MHSIVTCSDASRWACYNPAPLPLTPGALTRTPDVLQSAKVQRVQPADLLVQALSDEDEAEPGYEPPPNTINTIPLQQHRTHTANTCAE